MKCGILAVFGPQDGSFFFPGPSLPTFLTTQLPPPVATAVQGGMCWCWEMHLKLSENQFLEVAAADFLPHGFDKRRRQRFFFRRPGRRVCGDMQLSVVDEKKGEL